MAKTRVVDSPFMPFKFEIIKHVKSKIHEHDECELEWWYYVYSKSFVLAFPWAGETELYILHFLQLLQD